MCAIYYWQTAFPTIAAAHVQFSCFFLSFCFFVCSFNVNNSKHREIKTIEKKHIKNLGWGVPVLVYMYGNYAVEKVNVVIVCGFKRVSIYTVHCNFFLLAQKCFQLCNFFLNNFWRVFFAVDSGQYL